MHWKHALPIVLVIASAPLVVRGQNVDTESRRQVLATDDQRMDALRHGDAAPLREIYADDYSLVTPSGVIRSKADQINELASGRLHQQIELLERNVRLYDDVQSCYPASVPTYS